MWEFFPSRGPPPPPPVWEFFPDFTIYCWGVSHVKNSKKWKWDSGRPPYFLKIPTFSRFFWGGSVPYTNTQHKILKCCITSYNLEIHLIRISLESWTSWHKEMAQRGDGSSLQVVYLSVTDEWVMMKKKMGIERRRMVMVTFYLSCNM